MKSILFSIAFILFFLNAKSQSNILDVPAIKRIQGANFIENNNSYYFLQYLRGQTLNPYFPVFNASAYRLTKLDKFSHQIIASTIVYGDTLQADSVAAFFENYLLVKDDNVHIVFSKAFIISQDSIHYDLRYVQADTNLHITVPEKSLGSFYPSNMFIPFEGKIMITGGTASSAEYLLLDNSGNIVVHDTFQNKTAAQPRLAEVMPYNDSCYLVTGEFMLGNNIGRGMYLADTNLNIIDTFLNTPYQYNKYGLQGYIPRYPNIATLPTGSLISAGIFFGNTGNVSYLAKHYKANRFTIDTMVAFGLKDPLDFLNTPAPGIHNLEYNEWDNRVYYAAATHKDIYGGCNNDYNYIQIISSDTNLHTQWVKYLYFGPDSCAVVTKVSKPYNRSGVLVVVYADKISDNDPAFRKDYVFYIDSSGQTTFVKDQSMKIRDRMKIYPNPAKDYIVIDNLFGKLSRVEIYNLQGQKVFTKAIYGRSEQLNTSLLPSGIYLIKAYTMDNEIQNFKVVKD